VRKQSRNTIGGCELRILSGIKPSGALHIGNYFGMMQKMIEYQNRGELFCFIANLHSLTSVFNKEEMIAHTLSAAMDFLTLGIDPEKSFFWVQSDVPEVTELTWYLSNITPVGLLQRCHAYKDKVEKGLPANNGLFTYPVLMAADILAYQTNIVPVGQDQKQHVEVARDLADKFNSAYGEIFTLPEPEIAESVAIVPGVDGNKMSKSYGNTVEIFSEPKTLKDKIMKIVTDSAGVAEAKDPDKSTVYLLYKLFVSAEKAAEMADKFRKGGYGYGEGKKELLSTISAFFEPFRTKRKDLEKRPDDIRDILKMGAKKTRIIALQTLQKVRNSVGVIY
jgi:tryptophanyl-tRNA synthetase